MKRIALLTDSTADVPVELQKAYDIHVIPLSVVHKDKSYLDGIDITSEEFYKLLASTDVLPKSSQPSPGDFISVYKKLLEDYSEVISIHLSTGLSGTINAAMQAKEEFPGKIHVFDSKSISMGIGVQVLEAAKFIQAGLSSTEIISRLEINSKNVEAMFTLDTLEYLHKGGRIGKVSSIMGSLLNIKPIIRVENGIYVPFAKVRSQKSALEKIIAVYAEMAKNRKVISFGVAHGANITAANHVAQGLEQAFGIKASILTQVGPVIGVHTGPGALGVAVLFE